MASRSSASDLGESSGNSGALPLAGVPAGTIPGSRSAMGAYSTVTDFARLRGWSTSVPRATATW